MKIFQNVAKETKGFVISGCLGSDFCGSAAVSALYPNITGEKALNQIRTCCSGDVLYSASTGITLAYRWIYGLRGLKVSIAHNLYYLIHFNSKEVAS